MKGLKPNFIRKTFGLPAVLAIWMGLLCPVCLAGTLVEPAIILHDELSPDTPGYSYREVLFSQDGRTLIATSAKSIDYWDIIEKRIVRSYRPEDFDTNVFSSLSFSQDLSKFIFVNSRSGFKTIVM